MENRGYKNENIDAKYLESMRNYQFLKVKNSLLELEKKMELKDRELKDRIEKIENEIEELFHKPIIVSKDDLDEFIEQDMKKIRWFIY